MLEELGSSHTQTACSEEGYSNLSNLLNVVRVFIWDAVPDNHTKYLDNVDEDNYVSHCSWRHPSTGFVYDDMP